jgi:Flp pilus assembly pilin Flp
MKKEARTGNLFTEYALAISLVTVVAFGALSLLGNSLSGQFGQMASQPGTTSMLHPPSDSAAGNSTGAGPSSPGNRSGGIHATNISTIEEVGKTVETAGANGTTTMLADNLTKLAKEQLAAGLITEAQASTLFKLANQAYHLAEAEAAIEKVAQGKNLSKEAFDSSTVTIDGKQTTVKALLDSLGFSQAYDRGLLADPLNAMDYAHEEMATLLTLYNQAQASGALSNPAIKAQVQASTNQIASIADAFTFAAIDRTLDPAANSNLSASIASRLTDFSGNASTATAEHGDDICTVGNGQVYKGNGNRCAK